jgi:uncharacterized LabA/DUF88 family protein
MMCALFPVVLASARTGGVFSSRQPGGAPRVVVFLDYQNVYMGARETFGSRHATSRFGQVDPLALGQLIVARHPDSTQLHGVRVYRGRPDPQRDPRAYAANMRQSQAQAHRGGGVVTVVSRSLRYPKEWPRLPAEEKGIDVSLAVDLVAMAATGELDVAVVMSTDTDLVPALEAASLFAGIPYPRCELAGWRAPGQSHRRLVPKGRRLWCHWLDRGDFEAVRDDTDYNVGAP